MESEERHDRIHRCKRSAESRAGGARAARRQPPSPYWYAPLYGLLSGAIVLGGGLPQPAGLLVLAAGIAGLTILYRTWANGAGISLNGYRAGRTRVIAIGVAVVMTGLMLAGMVLRMSYGIAWAPFAAGAIAVPVAAFASAMWDHAWRAQIMGGRR